MTSIAAFLSTLAGGAPQDTLATPANAPGTGGIFAAFLAATGAPQGTKGEIAGAEGEIAAASPDPSSTPDPFSTLAASVAEQSLIEAAAGDAALRQALTEGLGLARDGAQIDAAIIENPDPASARPAESLLTGAAQIINGPPPGALVENPIAGNPAAQVAPEQVLAPVQEQNVTPPIPQVKALLENAQQTSGRGDTAAPATTPEDALVKSQQTARGAEPETGANRPVQSNSKDAAQNSGVTQGDDRFTAKDAAAPRSGTGENSYSFKPETSRSEFAPRGPEIIQQLLKPGSGQTLIRFQPHTGADSASVTSPPTLTVNVQTHAASPSPAPANVPHVPVSALAVHIAQQARNGAKRFDIRLDPPELGRIEVRLEVSREGQVTTHLVVERSETLDLLQRDARQLERALQDAGLNTSKEDMKFSLKDQNLAQGGDGEETPGDDRASSSGGESDDPLSLIPNDAMPPPTRYIAASGLDIRI